MGMATTLFKIDAVYIRNYDDAHTDIPVSPVASVLTDLPPSGIGVQASLAADASALIAKGMQIGLYYMLTIVGGDPVALNFAHGAADRLTCSQWVPGTKYKFKAVAVDIAAQKWTAGSASPVFCVEPLDGGSVNAGP
jgi:hypothetical protein